MSSFTTSKCPPPIPPKRPANELPQRQLFWPAVVVTATLFFAVGLFAREYLLLDDGGIGALRIKAEAQPGGGAVVHGNGSAERDNLFVIVRSSLTGDRYVEPVTGHPSPTNSWTVRTRLGDASSLGQTFLVQALATSHKLEHGPLLCSIPKDACLSNTVTLQHLP